MKKFRMIAVIGAFLVLSGCSTMYFHNGERRADVDLEFTEWHHDGIARLVEFSAPVDLAGRCEGKTWDAVKVEKSFVQGLVGSISYGLYDPWGVDYSCK